MITFTSLRKINFHPFRWARTAISMSSTVVRSSQPPDSSSAFILQTPAVPLKPKKLRKTPLTCCSTSKWKHRLIFWSLVSKFSALFTKAHLAWTNASSGLPCRADLRMRKGKWWIDYEIVTGKNQINLATLKCGTVCLRKSGFGWKSASKIATNS